MTDRNRRLTGGDDRNLFDCNKRLFTRLSRWGLGHPPTAHTTLGCVDAFNHELNRAALAVLPTLHATATLARSRSFGAKHP